MKINILLVFVTLFMVILNGCTQSESNATDAAANDVLIELDVPEYFQLRPEVEKAFGYTHAVKIGTELKISGAVSMDDEGNPIAVSDLEQQMKNVYSDLDKILKHYGFSFNDVIVENIFTTDMSKFLEVSEYRKLIYTKQFPTGTWIEVKGLAIPEFMIEIELEAHSSK